jgi:hypothetical protein
MDLIAETATIARQLLRDAASAPTTDSPTTTSGADAAPAAAAGAIPASEHDTPTVRQARDAALRVAAERSSLPDSAAAALDVVEHVRATLTSAVASLCAGVSAEIRALAQAKDAALQSEQTVRDDQLSEATAATGAALQAAAALGDADAVAHADAFVRRVAAVRHLVVSMPPAPQTSAAIRVSTDGVAAVLSALQRAVVLQEGGDGGGGGGGASSSDSTLPPLGASGTVSTAAAPRTQPEPAPTPPPPPGPPPPPPAPPRGGGPPPGGGGGGGGACPYAPSPALPPAPHPRRSDCRAPHAGRRRACLRPWLLHGARRGAGGLRADCGAAGGEGVCRRAAGCSDTDFRFEGRDFAASTTCRPTHVCCPFERYHSCTTNPSDAEQSCNRGSFPSMFKLGSAVRTQHLHLHIFFLFCYSYL